MEKTIFNTIIDLMNTVDIILDMGGKEKKAYVMNEIKKILTDEAYERYEPFISITIDGIVDISRKKIKVILNKNRCGTFCIPRQ
jgi:hypothetical protein